MKYFCQRGTYTFGMFRQQISCKIFKNLGAFFRASSSDLAGNLVRETKVLLWAWHGSPCSILIQKTIRSHPFQSHTCSVRRISTRMFEAKKCCSIIGGCKVWRVLAASSVEALVQSSWQTLNVRRVILSLVVARFMQARRGVVSEKDRGHATGTPPWLRMVDVNGPRQRRPRRLKVSLYSVKYAY